MDRMAKDFLTEWCLKRENLEPLTRDQAEIVAARWESDAEENGIDSEALRSAAGGEISDFLIRTYGEADTTAAPRD